MCTILQSVQSDLATFGGWCFLAGVFLMVTGDGLTNYNEPDVASAWPWMYLVPLGVSFLLMAVAGRIDPRRPSRAAVVYAPLAALLGAFALSAIFSQERALSGEAFAGLIAISVFWWYAGQVLEDRRLADATWLIVALGVLVLAVRVIAWRLTEGLDQPAYQIRSVVWLGKLQLTWVFNLIAPFLVARFISNPRRPSAIFNGVTWAVVGVANYMLLSRMGLLVFVLTTLAVCFANATYWRRWIWLMGAALAGGALLIANNLQVTINVASGFFDRSKNAGINMRLGVWEEAWRMFLEHPIAGVGIGAFDELVYRSPDTGSNPFYRMNGWHAHNVPLHILAEAGVLGLAAWVFLWFVIVRELLRARKGATREERLIGGATLVAVAGFHVLSMTEVMIGARVHAGLQMNLTIALLVVAGLRLSLPARAPAREVESC